MTSLEIDDEDIELEELKLKRDELCRQVASDTENLRKLNMVKMYRTKNNLSELNGLIDKWQTACQLALRALHDRLPEPRPTMEKLITEWNISPNLVNFDVDKDSFI